MPLNCFQRFSNNENASALNTSSIHGDSPLDLSAPAKGFNRDSGLTRRRIPLANATNLANIKVSSLPQRTETPPVEKALRSRKVKAEARESVTVHESPHRPTMTKQPTSRWPRRMATALNRVGGQPEDATQTVSDDWDKTWKGEVRTDNANQVRGTGRQGGHTSYHQVAEAKPLSVDVRAANAGIAAQGTFDLPQKVSPTMNTSSHQSMPLGPMPSFTVSDPTATLLRPTMPMNAPFLSPTTAAAIQAASVPAPSPTLAIDPQVLDNAMRVVLNERFGINDLRQMPPASAQALLSGPLPQLIAQYIQSTSLLTSPGSAMATAHSPTTTTANPVGPLHVGPQDQPTLLQPTPAPFPADALPSEIQLEQNTNLYLNGLGEYVTDDELLRIGAQYGEVISHKAIINSETGLCKGYGFIMYAWAKDAAVAMVELQKQGYQTSFARHESFSAKLRMMADSRSTNVYVSNLPLTMDDQQLEHLVAPHAIISRRILTKPDGSSRGVGFLRFHSRDIAQECIDRLHGKRIPGHPHPLQARFADSESQKRLKQDTTLRKVYADLDMGVLTGHTASKAVRNSARPTSGRPATAHASNGFDGSGLTTSASGAGGVATAPSSPVWGTFNGSSWSTNPLASLQSNATATASGIAPSASLSSLLSNAWPGMGLGRTQSSSAVSSGLSRSQTTGTVYPSLGTPTLSPSGSASTFNSPAMSPEASSMSHLASFGHMPFLGGLGATLSMSSLDAGSFDVERQLRELRMSALSYAAGDSKPMPQQHRDGGLPSPLPSRWQGPPSAHPTSGLGLAPQREPVSDGFMGKAAGRVDLGFPHHQSSDMSRRGSALSSLHKASPQLSPTNSHFVWAGNEKAAIPIINPETGKTYVKPAASEEAAGPPPPPSSSQLASGNNESPQPAPIEAQDPAAAAASDDAANTSGQQSDASVVEVQPSGVTVSASAPADLSIQQEEESLEEGALPSAPSNESLI